LKWIADNRLPTPGHYRYFNAVREIDNIVFRIIAERRASGTDEGDLLSMLLQAQDEDGSRMSDAQLRDEVMTLFLAGHETTALALSWSWYLLATHPEAERKFHAELDEVLGGRAPEVSDLAQLKFTEMIAKEAMRLYPPAYAIGREAIEETEIGGFRVPKGTQLFAFQWVTHRDGRFFERPDEFVPERWANGAMQALPKYAYFPFGGGPRQCIGNYFAMMEVVLLLATIGQRFRFVVEEEVDVLPVLSLRPKNGIKVRLLQRTNSLNLTESLHGAHDASPFVNC
jgi:cytochrome P450